jgi:hypothetical protein
VRRLLTWVAGVVGGLAAYRAMARRRRPAAETAPDAPDARVEELREKLAHARAPEEEPPPPERLEPDDPAGRRRAVHEQGKAALDEMRGD